MAERIFLLHRALTIRDMGTKEMRTQHDTIPEWVFHDPNNRPVYTKGTIHLDKERCQAGHGHVLRADGLG